MTSAALILWVDIDPADDEAFERWHSLEHVQERVSCPGWLRGSRFKGVDRPERYLLFYEAEATDAFESDVYYARLRNPSALSHAIFPRFRNTWRTVCTVERRHGEGIAAAALTLRLPAPDAACIEALIGSNAARVELLRGHADIGQAHTAEKDLRNAQDRTVEHALVAFFWSVDAARLARAAHAPDGEVFALRHSVSKGDLGQLIKP